MYFFLRIHIYNQIYLYRIYIKKLIINEDGTHPITRRKLEFKILKKYLKTCVRRQLASKETFGVDGSKRRFVSLFERLLPFSAKKE